MLVHDLDINSLAVLPYEADPETVVDPDTVLPGAVIPKRLQLQTGALQIVQRRRGMQDGELPIRHFRDGSEPPGPDTVEDLLRVRRRAILAAGDPALRYAVLVAEEAVAWKTGGTR